MEIENLCAKRAHRGNMEKCHFSCIFDFSAARRNNVRMDARCPRFVLSEQSGDAVPDFDFSVAELGLGSYIPYGVSLAADQFGLGSTALNEISPAHIFHTASVSLLFNLGCWAHSSYAIIRVMLLELFWAHILHVMSIPLLSNLCWAILIRCCLICAV